MSKAYISARIRQRVATAARHPYAYNFQANASATSTARSLISIPSSSPNC
jgi:hypothetical protein